MAIRLLPFRDYDEHDVINLFALADGDVNATLATVGAGDAGVVVKVIAGDLDASPITYADDNGYMMGTHTIPHLGINQYPSVPLRVSSGAIDASETDGSVIGITLRQTALADENGENLLRYPVKMDENHAVAKGQAVPIATKGIFMLDQRTLDSTLTGGGAVAGLSPPLLQTA
jgi:hypothetical protein